jgi:excisionase family DNA binding protein
MVGLDESEQTHEGPGAFERLLTLRQFADATNTSERFARRLIEERRIRYIKCGKFVRIPEGAMADFLAAGTVEPQR